MSISGFFQKRREQKQQRLEHLLENTDPDKVYNSDGMFLWVLRTFERISGIGFRYVTYYDDPKREGPYFVCPSCKRETPAVGPIFGSYGSIEEQEDLICKCNRQMLPISDKQKIVVGSAVQVARETYSGC